MPQPTFLSLNLPVSHSTTHVTDILAPPPYLRVKVFALARSSSFSLPLFPNNSNIAFPPYEYKALVEDVAYFTCCEDPSKHIPCRPAMSTHCQTPAEYPAPRASKEQAMTCYHTIQRMRCEFTVYTKNREILGLCVQNPSFQRALMKLLEAQFSGPQPSLPQFLCLPTSATLNHTVRHPSVWDPSTLPLLLLFPFPPGRSAPTRCPPLF